MLGGDFLYNTLLNNLKERKSMKKIFAMLFSVIILSTSSFLALSSTCKSSATIQAAYGTPVVDGVLDDVWSKAEVSAVDNVDKVVIPSSTKTVGTLRTMWDEDYLYVFIEVDKKGVKVYQGEGGSKVDVDYYDCAEITFSLAGNFDILDVSASAEDTVGDVRVFPDGTKTGFGFYYLSSAEDIVAVMKVTGEDTYVAEYAVPWNAVEPTEGHVVALEVQINDHSKPARDGLVTWASEEGCWGWQKTTVHGSVVLQAEVIDEPIEKPNENPSPETGDALSASVVLCLAGFSALSALKRKKTH